MEYVKTARFLNVFATLCLIITVNGYAQQKINWNGYLQYRFSENYSNQTGFNIRRAKLWIDGQLPFQSEEWGFRLQTIFFNKQNFRLQLLDAYINYSKNGFTIYGGQFVPDFSLQRKQADYRIPLNERANVINAIIPTAETLSRDIGAEIKYSRNMLGFSIGMFNGNGPNTLSKKMHLLVINRGYLVVKHQKSTLQMGYSFSYRHGNQLLLPKLLGHSVLFSGNDYRYGFDVLLKLTRIELQSEFLSAILNRQKAWGYYILSDFKTFPKQLAILSIEQLHDLNPKTIDNPWYILGYSYHLRNYHIKFTLDNRIKFYKAQATSMTTLQIQYFFNQ